MSITDRVELVRTRIADSCARAGRSPAEVTLVAVSKTQPPSALVEAFSAGVRHFGENRVEEAVDKIPTVNAALGGPVTWHMVGHVQSRKAKDAAALFGWIHSVDSLRLAHRLARAGIEQGRVCDVLLEVNVSGEPSKAGFDAADWSSDATVRERLLAEIAPILRLDGLRVHGLMTMAPLTADPETVRPVFAGLAALKRWLNRELGVCLSELSMGMTDDFTVAVEEGATMVRVGRAIFGETGEVDKGLTR